jgi:hypothetical protein
MTDRENEYLPDDYALGLATDHARRIKADASRRDQPEPNIDVDKLAKRLGRGHHDG